MTLDELLAPATRAELETSLYAAIEARGVKTTAWKPGSVARAIVTALALVLASLSVLITGIAKSAFLDYAEGDWLTWVARYVYGVERISATFATGTLTLTNSLGNLYTLGVGDLVALNPTTGATYRSTAAVTINPLSTTTVAVQCEQAGAIGTSAPGDISQLATTLTGVAVTNATALVAYDTEEDPDLRTRCREVTGPLSPNGPKDAYAYVAKSARRPDGSAIGVTRVRCIPDGVGGVDVYVATATGGVSGTEGNPATDLGIIAAAIWQQCEPLCVTARLHSAGSTSIAITYELWLDAVTGRTDAQVAADVLAALTKYLATVPIGGEVLTPPTGYVYRLAIAAVIGSAIPGVRVLNVTLTTPAGNTAIGATNAPVLGAVTATVHQVVS